MQLLIEGKSDVETKLIDSLNYSNYHLDYSSIETEIDSLRKRLFNIGFIENKLENVTKFNDSTFFALIYLKKKIDTIYIYYNDTVLNKDLINSISYQIHKDHFILPIDKTEESLNYLNSKIAEDGFPFAKLKLIDIKAKDSSSLQAKLIIESERTKRNIDQIIIKGYEKFPKSYLKHFVKIKPSQVFDLNTIKKKTSLLNDLKFANEIKPPEVLFTEDSTSLYLYIEKRKSNSFDGFLGFGTNEDNGKLKFDGYLNLSLINNLNYGETFNLTYKSDASEQKSFNANLKTPYLFGSPLGAELELRIFKKDSSFTTVNQKARTFYQVNPKNTIYLGFTSTQSNDLLSQNTAGLITDYDSKYYSIGYQHTSSLSDNILFPYTSSFYFETGFGQRKIEGVSEKQNLTSLDGFKIFKLNHTNSIYFRINSGALFSDNYVENELLRFGGINSIRGFEENSLVASLYGLINSEYRIQFARNLYIHSILDFAYFENEIALQKEKLYSFGLGFGIINKAGLLKFNYANGKIENQKFKFSNSKIHISLIADF
ncbi:POTRA domain-containing protein [Yeosuana sp. MJ-SS3]|uniref:POTRA domain-containing protein n=1 Tax=Gilvirhabdus luticola TaxID=3079858 RepID=A0ABU3U671_9FLAO|nr:POTRA domain-containing protein [Yeosuana sp. MJ-SS3]MDU8885903.1 POTRA domain-containing protein [Yeosuana sp. MJ-SS3]